MKHLFLSLLAMFAVVGTVSAQDAPVNRSLSFYLDSFSGHLTEAPGFKDGMTSRAFSGNEFEFGMSYSQNFATAPWLSMWVKALVVTGLTTAYNTDTGDFIGNAGQGFIQPYGMPRVQLGLNFGGYAILAMDTRGLIAQCNNYSVALPGNGGTFTFNTALEFFAVPQAIGTSEIGGAQLGTEKTFVDLFALTANYGINFAPNWAYSTKIAFRFGGSGSDQSAELFKESFAIRWENKIAWSVTPSFSMWTQIRYHIANLASNKAVDHNLFLQAGLGYSFDFSDN